MEQNAKEMSSNSSSASGDSFLTGTELLLHCLTMPVGVASFAATACVYVVFFLPLCVFVLYLGHQQSPSSGVSSMSHSDFFTYNMIVTDLVKTLGAVLALCGAVAKVAKVTYLGLSMLSIHFFGQIAFHVLTCVERYVAVVHPITYMSLRSQRGTRIRNTITTCSWLICFMFPIFNSVLEIHFSVGIYYVVVCSALSVVTFCSVVVLCVLIRPGPGKGGVDKFRIDQSKLRAFYVIVSILGVLLLTLLGNVTISIADSLVYFSEVDQCFWWMSELWYSLPSSLLLPLLFLHRAGKLPCGRRPETGGQRRH